MKNDRNVFKKSLIATHVFFTSVLDVMWLENDNAKARSYITSDS